MSKYADLSSHTKKVGSNHFYSEWKCLLTVKSVFSSCSQKRIQNTFQTLEGGHTLYDFAVIILFLYELLMTKYPAHIQALSNQ